MPRTARKPRRRVPDEWAAHPPRPSPPARGRSPGGMRAGILLLVALAAWVVATLLLWSVHAILRALADLG